MGMNLAIRTDNFGAAENHEWIGSSHGVDTGESLTLDAALLMTAFPSGVVPSGVALGQVTATGRYARVDPAAVDGRQVMACHLLTTQDLTAGGKAPGGANTPAAGYWHGRVIVAKLPAGHGLPAAGRPATIRYV